MVVSSQIYGDLNIAPSQTNPSVNGQGSLTINNNLTVGNNATVSGGTMTFGAATNVLTSAAAVGTLDFTAGTTSSHNAPGGITLASNSASGNITLQSTGATNGGIALQSGATGVDVETSNNGPVLINCNGNSAYTCTTKGTGALLVQSTGAASATMQSTTNALNLYGKTATNLDAYTGGGPVTVGTANATSVAVGSATATTAIGGPLTVAGTLAVTGNTTLTGNLTVNGSTTTISSTINVTSDPVFVLNNSPALSAVSPGVQILRHATNTTAAASTNYVSFTLASVQSGANTSISVALGAGATYTNYAGWYAIVGSDPANLVTVSTYTSPNAAMTLTNNTTQAYASGTAVKFYPSSAAVVLDETTDRFALIGTKSDLAGALVNSPTLEISLYKDLCVRNSYTNSQFSTMVGFGLIQNGCLFTLPGNASTPFVLPSSVTPKQRGAFVVMVESVADGGASAIWLATKNAATSATAQVSPNMLSTVGGVAGESLAISWAAASSQFSVYHATTRSSLTNTYATTIPPYATVAPNDGAVTAAVQYKLTFHSM